MAAGPDRRGHHHGDGISDWLYCKLMVGLGSMGLQ